MVADREGIAFQHRRLDGFVDEVQQALERDDRRQCETAAFRLQGAVHAHFDVETQVIFPAVHARHPGLARELDALEGGHKRLLVQLEALCVSVFASDAGTVHTLLAEFRQGLERHERSEESLLESIDTLEDESPRDRKR